MSTPIELTKRSMVRLLGAGALGGVGLVGASTADGGLERELAAVRSGTAEYNDPEHAYDDGYVVFADTDDDGSPELVPLEDVVEEGHAVCGMGFHFVNPGLVGSTEPTEPTVLVYGVDDDGDLVLGAVEWVVPKAGPYEEDPPDLFEHDGGSEIWQEDAPADGLWSLHAWVHNHNPDGVFHPFNPRPLFHPEGCVGPGDH